MHVHLRRRDAEERGRPSGGRHLSLVTCPIEGKPSLSLKFDEFVKGQRLFDLDKLILKNELQDLGLVNEHLTYEVFRRAGLAASMTAHARVTINGIDVGIYLLREPIDKDFLVRNFGKGFETGQPVRDRERAASSCFSPGAEARR